MSIIKSIAFLIVVASAKGEENGYPKENPSSRFVYDGVSTPVEKFTDEDMTGGEIPGEAGKDYPVFRDVPETRFECGQQQYPGYYSDVETRCQAFHICQKSGRKDSFLCPNGTVFNQQNLICDWWYNFDCANAQSFYSVNEAVLRAMEEADRLSAGKKNAQQAGYRYDSPIASGGSRFQQDGQSPLENPPRSDFDTVVVEAARTSSSPQLPLRAQRPAYNNGPEAAGSLTKGRIEDLDSGLKEAPKITGVSFGPKDPAASPVRGYLPAEF